MSGTGSLAKCSFCHSIGHNRTSCPARKSFGRDYTTNPDNLMHILSLPIQNLTISLYESSNVPVLYPQIPHEACRIVITNFHAPRIEPKTTNSSWVFVSLRLYTFELESCDKIGGYTYTIDEIRKWIMVHIIQSKSNKRFSIHLNTDSSFSNHEDLWGQQTPSNTKDSKPPAVNFDINQYLASQSDQEADV